LDSLVRSPGESRDPPGRHRTAERWVPAFAGTAAKKTKLRL